MSDQSANWKFKDKHGYTRWQAAKADVKQFCENHKEELGQIAILVLLAVLPKGGQIRELIEAIDKIKAKRSEKKKVLNALNDLLENIDDQA